MNTKGISINFDRLGMVGKHLAGRPYSAPFNFYSITNASGESPLLTQFPSPIQGEHAVLEFFFAETLQEHGFWQEKYGRWQSSIRGTINGKKLKGSDLMCHLLMLELRKSETQFKPSTLATMQFSRFMEIMHDDLGAIDFPDMPKRYMLWRLYAEWMVSRSESPHGIIEKARESKTPAQTFLGLLKEIPGFNEDPFQKKSNLLLMYVMNRPERFIVPELGFSLPAMIDYHVMRLLLRFGVVCLSAELRIENQARSVILEEREATIRHVCEIAMNELVSRSRLPMSEVDALLWNGREFCLEATEPDCGRCSLRAVCAQETKLFQPVYRTTHY